MAENSLLAMQVVVVVLILQEEYIHRFREASLVLYMHAPSTIELIREAMLVRGIQMSG